MERCDALLIQPSESKYVPELIIQEMKLAELLGLEYLSSYAESEGYRVDILDLRFLKITNEELIRYIKRKAPKVIGVSIMFHSLYKESLRLISLLCKNINKVHFTVGGQFATVYYKELLQNMPMLNSVVISEGEKTFSELIEAVSNNRDIGKINGLAFKDENGIIFKTPPRQLINNLDSIPFPKRDSLPVLLQHGSAIQILTSRGCANNCSFCGLRSFYNKCNNNSRRTRTIENRFFYILICEKCFCVSDSVMRLSALRACEPPRLRRYSQIPQYPQTQTSLI